MAFRTITRWYGRLFNDRGARRLRSDRHGTLSKNHLLITMTGRKTGKRITIPVNYHQAEDGRLVIGTESSWWHNLEGGADVELLIAGDPRQGRAEPVIDDLERRERRGRLISGPTWPLFSRSLVVIEITLADPAT